LREPTLKEKSATFLKLILPKFLENANNATPPRPAKGGGVYPAPSLLWCGASTKFSSPIFGFRAPQKIQIRKKKIWFRRLALTGRRMKNPKSMSAGCDNVLVQGNRNVLPGVQ